jgi:hypothetical protein
MAILIKKRGFLQWNFGVFTRQRSPIIRNKSDFLEEYNFSSLALTTFFI